MGVSLFADAWSKASFSTITIGIVTSSITAYIAYNQIMRFKLQQKLQAFCARSSKENKIILHTSKPWKLCTPHGSPAVAKLIAFLEYGKLEYVIDDTMPKHFHTTKTPWITYKNEHLTDSNLIIQWILDNHALFHKQLQHLDMDSHLNKTQLATSLAFKSMIENDFYFILIWRRFCLHDNIFVYLRLMVGDQMPSVLLSVFAYFFRKKQREKVWLHGIGRFQPREIEQKHREMMQSLFDYMGDNAFMFGDKPTTLDLCIYGHVGGMYQLCSVMSWGESKRIPSRMPLTEQVNEYMKRVETACFGQVKYWKDIALG